MLLFGRSKQTKGEKPVVGMNRNISYLCKKGDELDELGQYEQAISYYDQALQTVPNDKDILNSKGVSLYNLDKNEDALSCFENALAINPNQDTVLYNKAVCLYKLKKYQRAQIVVHKAIKINPNDADYQELIKEINKQLLPQR